MRDERGDTRSERSGDESAEVAREGSPLADGMSLWASLLELSFLRPLCALRH
jgi:hypothetical protein